MNGIQKPDLINFNVAFEGSFKDTSGESLQGRIKAITLHVESLKKSFVAQVAGKVNHGARSYLQFLTSANTGDRLVPVQRVNNLTISASFIPNLSIRVCLNDGTLRNLRVACPANVQPNEKYTLLITHDQTDALSVEFQPQITPTCTCSIKTSLSGPFKENVPLSHFNETDLSDTELDLMTKNDLFALFFRNNERVLACLPPKENYQDRVKGDHFDISDFEKLIQFTHRISTAIKGKIPDSTDTDTKQLCQGLYEKTLQNVTFITKAVRASNKL